jgi:hypothetical protein
MGTGPSSLSRGIAPTACSPRVYGSPPEKVERTGVSAGGWLEYPHEIPRCSRFLHPIICHVVAPMKATARKLRQRLGDTIRRRRLAFVMYNRGVSQRGFHSDSNSTSSTAPSLKSSRARIFHASAAALGVRHTSRVVDPWCSPCAENNSFSKWYLPCSIPCKLVSLFPHAPPQASLFSNASPLLARRLL